MLQLATSAADRMAANTLFLVGSAILVLLMVPAVMLFYGRRRPFLVAYGPMLLVAVLWIAVGYGLVFGAPLLRGFLGDPLQLPTWTPKQFGFAAYHGAVAVFTIALISSAFVGRVRAGAWVLFAGLWTVLVYFPVAYAVFNVQDGWVFNDLQVNDQAGGTVIQIGGGAAVLGVLLALRRRGQRPRSSDRRASATLLGAGLLWIGWFGLNAGSEGVVDALVPVELLNTLLAPLAGLVAWALVERIRHRRNTLRGAASGALAGLVAITPACNILTPGWALGLGVLAGAVCALAVGIGPRFGFGDSFEVVGIHLTGGILGMLYIGLFGSGIGWRDNGQPDRFIAQVTATVEIALYSLVVAFIVAWVIDRTLGLRSAASSPPE